MQSQEHESRVQKPEKLLSFFSNLDITITTHYHEAVNTVEEGRHLQESIPGAHTKNLFLKNKKNQHVLISMLHDKQLDLKQFQKNLGLGSLSFASKERLEKYLGIQPRIGYPVCFSECTS